MEPKWLIGGPESTEQVTTPQQSAQTTMVHGFHHDPDRASSEGLCGKQGWRGDAPLVTCPDCLGILAQVPQEPAQSVAEAPAQPEVPQVPSEPEGRYKGKTAAQWRALAQGRRVAEHESFDRCDTDGAVTQYVASLHAREYELCARLAEKDGIWEFPALFTLTGALVPQAQYVKTRLNKWVWRIGTGDIVSWFDPSKARKGNLRRANDRAKGFMVGLIRARGFVGTSGSGRGFSGLTSVGYFVGQVKDSPVEIIDDGSQGTQYQDY